MFSVISTAQRIHIQGYVCGHKLQADKSDVYYVIGIWCVYNDQNGIFMHRICVEITAVVDMREVR